MYQGKGASIIHLIAYIDMDARVVVEEREEKKGAEGGLKNHQ